MNLDQSLAQISTRGNAAIYVGPMPNGIVPVWPTMDPLIVELLPDGHPLRSFAALHVVGDYCRIAFADSIPRWISHDEIRASRLPLNQQD
jgi:hypothetical protein